MCICNLETHLELLFFCSQRKRRTVTFSFNTKCTLERQASVRIDGRRAAAMTDIYSSSPNFTGVST